MLLTILHCKIHFGFGFAWHKMLICLHFFSNFVLRKPNTSCVQYRLWAPIAQPCTFPLLFFLIARCQHSAFFPPSLDGVVGDAPFQVFLFFNLKNGLTSKWINHTLTDKPVPVILNGWIKNANTDLAAEAKLQSLRHGPLKFRAAQINRHSAGS